MLILWVLTAVFPALGGLANPIMRIPLEALLLVFTPVYILLLSGIIERVLYRNFEVESWKQDN